jgi:hypothetical protein
MRFLKLSRLRNDLRKLLCKLVTKAIWDFAWKPRGSFVGSCNGRFVMVFFNKASREEIVRDCMFVSALAMWKKKESNKAFWVFGCFRKMPHVMRRKEIWKNVGDTVFGWQIMKNCWWHFLVSKYENIFGPPSLNSKMQHSYVFGGKSVWKCKPLTMLGTNCSENNSLSQFCRNAWRKMKKMRTETKIDARG